VQQLHDKVRARAAIPILQWGPRAPQNAASTPSLLQELLKNNKRHPRFLEPAGVDWTGKLIIGGQNLSRTGPDAFGSLSSYLESASIKYVIVYTDTGRINSGNS
jgi:hypothetical protein